MAAIRNACRFLLLVVPLIHVLASPAVAQGVSGVVVDAANAQPVPHAIVTLQATTERATTDASGAFDLPSVQGNQLVIVAAKKGFYNVSTTVNAPAVGVVLQLEAVTIGNNPAYSFESAFTCATCHPYQFAQWAGSPMNAAGTNTWVYDIYDGTGSTGGLGGFVYTRDSVHAASNPNSECASCHQPEPWIQQPHKALDPIGSLSAGSTHGISCEVCHKIADVDEAQMNYPGIWPGIVTFNRPDDPLALHQVQYGALGDTSYALTSVMRPSYNDELVAETCGACHQDKNDPDGNGLFEEPNGVVSEPTYWEWKNSEYADPLSPHYASCVACHMPSYGVTTVAIVAGSPQRDPETIRSHRIEGTTPAYLENAVELTVDVQRGASAVRVGVEVFNRFTGHHVPTGVTVRNMVLVVEAVSTTTGQPLTSLGTQVVHALGGVGPAAQGYYAGLPGKLYAKVNHDQNGNGPTFFTDATGIQFDNRIPALESDATGYLFAAPPGTGEVEVRARLIYRRAFRFLVDAKQWTTDGHGNPLADVQAPHYGHLMEEVVAYTQPVGPGTTYCDSDSNSTGAPAQLGAEGTSSLAANNLVIAVSNVPAPTFGQLVVGSGQTSTPLGNGELCIANVQGRFPVIGPTGAAVLRQPVDLASLPGGMAAQAGDTLLFQFWFRDVVAGASLFDLSDGYRVVMTP